MKNFEYLNEKNIIKSVGYIKISDSKKNNYELSQIYIDQNKKEIIGTDIKAFFNSEDFKVNKKNKPRIFANTFGIKIRKQNLKIAYLLSVITERKINALRGPCNLLKFCMTMSKKHCFTKML